MDRPHHLRVEHLEDPLGVSWARPRLSWWLPTGSRRQHAHRLRTDRWEGPWRETDQHVLVPYDGPAPASRERVTWQVQTRTDAGESEWSDTASWELGLAVPADWSAHWIGPDEPDRQAPGERPAHLLRRELELPGPATRARAYATAHGIYELEINGVRVGDLELTPGFTAYRTNLDVQTYDVTDLLHAGPNVIGAVLSDGWWRGKTNYTRQSSCYGGRTALLVQLEADHADGTRTTVVSDAAWRSSTGGITRADLIDGEALDLRDVPAGWSTAGFDSRGWAAVRRPDLGLDRLTTSPAPPVRRVEQLEPVSFTTLADGDQVIDLGQNINGWLRVRVPAVRDLHLRIEHGERLHPDGSLDVDHLMPVDWATKRPLGTGQVDEVTSAGEPATFEPRHTTHGFQFAQVSGLGSPLEQDAVAGVVVHSDLERTGWFRCSDDRINRLHEAAVWSFRTNACDIPTDCPQRERVGWTGDYQLFVPTAAFLYDVAGFSRKWLRDLAADQWPDGRVPNYVPDTTGPLGHEAPENQFLTGSAGWGDAAVIVPWELWQAYGDDQVLADQLDSMAAWVDFAAGRAASGRHHRRAKLRPEPGEHERHLWDSGFHWGEWCEPGGNQADVFTLKLDLADVATAYLHRSSHLLSRAGEVLGRTDVAERYGALAADVRAAWQTEFIDADGRLTPDTQANHVRALTFGLVPHELRQRTADRLAELVHDADDHLTTGFLATPGLLPALADHGHLDVAYGLLFQDTPPSWLSMIDQGATTIWENWEGVDADGNGSLNHYSKGAVISFLHRHVAGLRLDEDAVGYRRFTVAPRPGGGITSAELCLHSPRGPIRIEWQLEGDRFLLEVEVPPGADADVVLPSGARHHAGPGTTTTYEEPS
jgi:alpha-L-rhamnosidase